MMVKLHKDFLFILILLLTWNTSLSQIVEDFKKHVAILSSDSLMGRGQGSEGIRLASEYISYHFKSIGLESYNQSYFQAFHLPNQAEVERNVIGIIPAKGPTSKSLVFTAHYDAYGIKSSSTSTDSIYNGALDNATGVAALIELARIYASSGSYEQHIVFIATAAEEIGAFGSAYYVENPAYPAKDISICLNLDGVNVSGEREDYFVMPRQGIDFIPQIEKLLNPYGWVYFPPNWVDQMNNNFDTQPFLAVGIPAITIWTGNRLKGGKEAPRPLFGPIHSPEDEINEYWNWDGVEEHIFLYKTLADYILHASPRLNVINPDIFKQ